MKILFGFKPVKSVGRVSRPGSMTIMHVRVINLRLFPYRLIVEAGKSYDRCAAPFKAVHGKAGDMFTFNQ